MLQAPSLPPQKIKLLLHYGLKLPCNCSDAISFHGSMQDHVMLTMLIMLLVQDCLEMRCVGGSTEGLPPGVATIPGPRTQRQVLCACRLFT